MIKRSVFGVIGVESFQPDVLFKAYLLIAFISLKIRSILPSVFYRSFSIS